MGRSTLRRLRRPSNGTLQSTHPPGFLLWGAKLYRAVRLLVGRLDAKDGDFGRRGMADRHLNLFYTYNRDNELIENNLTRAFIVSLSIVSDETRHGLLSALFERSRTVTAGPVSFETLDFTDARFALQSNIDRRLPKNAGRQLLLTVSTEPLDFASSTAGSDMEPTDGSLDDSAPTSVPDAWVYSNAQGYCILIESKVGSYPLNIGQLEAHARDWFGTSLQALDSRNSLCSATWIDVLGMLRDFLNDNSCTAASEKTLLSHLMEFIGYYGYRLFDGFDFGSLDAPPDLIIGPLLSPERKALDLTAHRLAQPPEFVFAYWTSGPRKDALDE